MRATRYLIHHEIPDATCLSVPTTRFLSGASVSTSMVVTRQCCSICMPSPDEAMAIAHERGGI
jgi:hypothetical protein